MDENQLFNSENGKNNIPPVLPEPPKKQEELKKNINYNTNYNTNYYKNNKKGCLFWGLVVLAVFITVNSFLLFGIFSLFAGESSAEDYVSHDYVDLLKIEGTISRSNINSYGIKVGYQHEWLLEKIESLKHDDYNKGLLLYINSGGGTTYESDEMYKAIKSYREETGRPVYAYYANTAASGALYISMAADEIYANRMTTTGSIGVRLTTYNTKELMDKLGIKEVTIKTGENKNMLSPTEEVTQEQIDIYQSIIDESYDYFVEAVAEGRGIPLEKAYELADGRVYSAKQALELNLIDGIMDYSDFIDLMYEKEEFADCSFYEENYTDNSILGLVLSKTGIPSTESSYSEAELLKDLMEETSSLKPEFSYGN